jgi:hypothetical protein
MNYQLQHLVIAADSANNFDEYATQWEYPQYMV